MPEPLGLAKCPLCGNAKAKLKLSSAGLACLSCTGCSCQIFARSGTSDEKLRAMLVDKPAQKPAPKVDDTRPTVTAKEWDPYA